MKCKAPWCDLESRHKGKCRSVVADVTNVVTHRSPVTNTATIPVTNTTIEVTNESKYKRQYAWRRAHREEYNTAQRDRMRRKRAS